MWGRFMVPGKFYQIKCEKQELLIILKIIYV